MKTVKLVILLALWAGAAAAEVVVLRGGTRIDLKQPPTRQGSTVLLTRRDGTLLSVPVSEIDQQATSAANAAAAAAPPVAPAAKASAETPASAARAAREGPKARVKLTDADVGHYLEVPGGGSGEEKKEGGGGAGSGASVDISTYTQSKTGDNLIVKGSLRNLGTTAALNARLTVTPIDDKGQPIDSAEASISSGTIEPGREVNFSATIPVGNRVVQTMRFSPRWVSQATPAETAAAAAAAQASALPGSGTPGSSAAAAPAAAASKAPRPVPTPYGLGLNYAPPPPNAAMAPPPDGKTGYIPGAATPENQPKPPE